MPDNVERWLTDLGLDKYADTFDENGVDFALLSEITNEDLKDLGVSRLADRKAILKAASSLAVEVTETVSDSLPQSPPAPPAAVPSSEAERRQLTVMFCDMAGSTALSARLDPEDYREVVRSYQDACARVISRRGGYVGKFLGDGVLAYFGYPQAHEDDARQAINAGLGILAAVADIDMPEGEEPLAVRVGIATGPVVIGDIIGEGSAQEVAVTGETPNFAARLQALAEPNTIVVAPSTHALAGGLFDYQALGPQTLKGIDGTPEVWRVIGERRVESRFAAAHGPELTPLIGREEELELLVRRWNQAKDGEGRVVLLSGEPGIGKSRLVRALRDRIADEPHTRLIYQCSPHHTSSALYPVISQLEHATNIGPGDGADARLDKLERLLAQARRSTADIMPLIASLLSIPAGERYPLLDLTPQQLKDHTLAALLDQLVGLAEQQPVLFVFEDAHWIDPTSLELMNQITARITDLSVLIIVTYRPEFPAPWIGLPDVTTLNLSRLNARACATMAEQIAGADSLPSEVMTQLVAKTDGVPLFVEELTRSILDVRASSIPDIKAARAEQDTRIVIPATLQEALEARLDRSPQVREVAQVSAAIGREFPYDLLARVTAQPSAELDSALDDLVSSGLIFARGEPPDASYAFKHALVQETAYESMMRSKRRETHRRIAEVLPEVQPDVTEAEPAVLARHYTEAGQLENAIDWWTRAGRAAAARSANPEAVNLLERGLSLVTELPESDERDRRELGLQTALFGPLITVKGQFSREWEVACNRTLELCEAVDAPEEMFRVLFAKSLAHILRGQHSKAIELAQDLLQRAERAANEEALIMGHRMAAHSLFNLGRPSESVEHGNFVLRRFDRARHGHLMRTYGQDPAVVTRSYYAVCHWTLGWPDKAVVIGEHAIAEALELNHTSTLAPSMVVVGLFGQWMSRDADRFRLSCDVLRDMIAQHHTGTWALFVRVVSAVLESMTDPTRQSAMELNNALIAFQSLTPNTPILPICWGKALAENYMAIGDMPNAMHANEKGIELSRESEQYYSNAELLRVRGDALAMRDGVEGNEKAEGCLRRAIEDARSRSAKSFELRAATSLARFLREQGRSVEARDVLAPVYDWFTEGFGTPDLIDAKALLDELS